MRFLDRRILVPDNDIVAKFTNNALVFRLSQKNRYKHFHATTYNSTSLHPFQTISPSISLLLTSTLHYSTRLPTCNSRPITFTSSKCVSLSKPSISAANAPKEKYSFATLCHSIKLSDLTFALEGLARR